MTLDPELAADPHYLQAIIDASGDCIKVLDLEAQLLFMNAGGLQVMEVDDFRHCHLALWPSFWAGAAREQVERALAAARAGQVTSFEAPAATFAGTPKWWAVRVSPLRNAQGTITHLLAISTDITARKRVEQLQDGQAQLQRRALTLEDQVGQTTQALAAFVQFTTTVASTTDLDVLGTAATSIIREAVEGASSAFYRVEHGQLRLLASSGRREPQGGMAQQDDLSLHSPLVVQAFEQDDVLFSAHDPAAVDVPGAWSVTPYQGAGQPYALLVAHAARAVWTAQERAIIASVSQGLGLALERAQRTRQLQEHAAGLDAFVAFKEAVGVEMNLHRLVEQAIRVVQAHLSGVSVAYYELDQSCWKGVIWTEEISADIVAQMRAGIPTDAQNFAEAARLGVPVFSESWNAAVNHLPAVSPYVAVAFSPLWMGGEVRAMFAVGKQLSDSWTPHEQAIVRAVVRGLELSVERTEQARELTRQRDELNERTRELEEANAALEAFTYSVSHDLRTPVRHVMTFTELAQKAVAQGNLERVGQQLQVVKQGAERMTALIDGMLALSRSGRHQVQVGRVDLNAVAAQARRDVEMEFAGQRVHWRVGALPVVQGDERLLQLVMTNLLGNAVKYSSKARVSEVAIWAQEDEEKAQVWVRDNGVGFDPAYTHKLFGIFQRLHAYEDFPGSGVGLATVKRIVMKHGGQVFAQRPEGGGALFSFTLPKRLQKQEPFVQLEA